MDLLDAPPLWAELRADTLHVSDGTTGEDIPLALDAEGRPDDATKARISGALARLSTRRPWQTRSPVWCALPARGVSVRRVRIPATSPAELRRVLRLQVEATFPIPPEELAWGWSEDLPAAVGGFQEVTVVAVRKQSVEPWAAVFAGAGLDPVFTLGSVARTSQQQKERRSFIALDLTARAAEIAVFKEGVLVQVRALPWSLDRLAGSVAGELGAERSGLESVVLDAGRRGESDTAILKGAAPLLEAVRAAGIGDLLVLTGNGPLLAPLALVLENASAPMKVIGPVVGPVSPGRTDAVVGLRDSRATLPPICLSLPSAVVPTRRMSMPTAPSRWAARGAALLAAVLLFPYAEAYVGRPRLARKLAVLKKDLVRLGEIDRRLDFLEHLSASQPPYLDASFVVANAAPPGTKIESCAMDRRGEVSLGGYVQQPPQAVEFRTKLMESKFFSSVVVEELTPVQNNQRVNFRITAQWKAAADREALQLGPPLPESPKTNAPAGATNAPATRSDTKASVPDTNPPPAVARPK